MSDKNELDDPMGGHDQEALDEAAERMKATKPSDATNDETDAEDPNKEHDAGALKDAEKKMGVDR